MRKPAWMTALLKRLSTNLTVKDPAVADVRLEKDALLDRFGSILPYGYEIEEGLFSIAAPDGSLEAVGYVLEVTPQTGASPEMAKHLETIFASDLPTGCGLQVSVFASPDVKSILTAFTASRTPVEVVSSDDREQTEMLNRLAIRRAEYLDAATMAPIAPASHFRVRDFRAWLAVTVPIADITSEIELTKVRRLREKHIATLKTFFLYGYTWGACDLKATLSMLTNPAKALFDPLKTSAVDPHRPIANQVVHADTHVSVEETGVLFTNTSGSRVEKQHIRAVGVSVHGYPAEYALALVAKWLGGEREAIPCPFLMTTVVAIPDFEKTKSRANLMAARSKQIAGSEIAHYLPSLKKRADDYEIVTEEYAAGGGLCHVTHQMLLLTPENLTTESVNAAVSVLKAAHLEPVVDTRMHLQSYLLSLPMTMGPLMQKDLKTALRSSTKTLSNVTHMVPLLAEFKGTGVREREESITPLVLMTGRRGQLTPFDLFATNGNFNAIIVGTSGSGKSALTNDLITGNLGTGGKTYVIDVGGSYRKLCSLLNGQWIEFTEKVDLVINPFDLVKDIKEDMGFILPILVQMASPNDGLSDYLKSVLQSHVIHVIERARSEQRSPTLTDLVESLRSGAPDPTLVIDEPDPRLFDLAVQLEPYAANGTYGRYFNGQSTIDFYSNFIVLELEGLKSRKDLQSVILLCLIFRITKDLEGHDLQTRKMVVIDEAWDLLSHRYAASFIENGYRRARKQNASFITITQSFADYYQNETARAALENADIRIALRQKAESISFLEKEKKLAMSPWEIRQLKSLRLQPDEYAECLVTTPETPAAVLQVRFDAFSRLAYSSNANDVAAIRSLMETGLSLVDAIEALVKDKEAQR